MNVRPPKCYADIFLSPEEVTYSSWRGYTRGSVGVIKPGRMDSGPRPGKVCRRGIRNRQDECPLQYSIQEH